MKTLLVISQVYVPDPAAVGQHMADLAEEMARRGWRVVVYTSARGYDDPTFRYAWREQRHGIDIRRLPLSSFGKQSIAIRLLAQAIFMLQAVACGVFTRGLSGVLVSTSPPFAGMGGAMISWLRGAPLTWWVMDLNPDQMIATGKIAPRSLPARVFDWMNRVTLRQASAVIALDRFMKDRLVAKLSVAENIHVVSPWAPDDDMTADPVRVAAFREQHGLSDRFVVMYSGNHAIQHPLTTLLDAAKTLEEDHRIVFVFVGGGAGKQEVERRIEAGATNIFSLPYQPLSTLPHSLAAADLHVVSMGDDMVGIIHPCKIYGALAAGRPILFFGPTRSHAGEILGAADIGWSVSHGDVTVAVDAIRAASTLEPIALAAIGDRSRELGCVTYGRRSLLNRCCDILQETCKT